MKKIAAYLFVAIAGGAVALGLFYLTIPSEKASPAILSDIPVQQTAYSSPVPPNVPDFEMAAETSIHAVVHIRTQFYRKSVVYDDFFEFFNFRQPSPREKVYPYEAMGSGVIISADGYIVTNNHVVQEANEIMVTLNDRREYPATIVGTDPATDLALIKIEEQNLPFLAYGNSDEVKIGEWVLAVGNPFNLTSTVTAGIVSAKARNINILGAQGAIESFIQTDAAVNRGNSGGALVNTRGELIGINAAIASGNGYYQGYSFAIPVNIVRKVVSDFMEHGKIQRAYIGIYYREVDQEFAAGQGMDLPKGILIEEVVASGAAEKAGLRKGDVILQMEQIPINRMSELTEFMGQHSPGDRISVKVLREGIEKDFTVILQSNESVAAVVRDNKIIILGATFEPLTTEDQKRFGIDYGFRITNLQQGKLEQAGLREGFILLAVDRIPMKTPADLEAALTARKGGVLLEGLYPNGLKAYYGIGL